MKTMDPILDKIDCSEYQEVVDVWEASVRATHHFLKEEDINHLKPLILNQYLKDVDLSCVRTDRGNILGFIGVAGKKIEMLFLHPESRGKGIGKMLVQFALKELEVTKVDVNEDNHQAVGFYKHLGFKVKKRSPLDPSGKPYPILHMELI